MANGSFQGESCDRPIAVTYEITKFGRTALDILEKLKSWTEDNHF
ncbi:Transcriptional regulator [Shewanella piezotolerans WP3]|uniref:Transcriptional regulator n=1 Tax=Shewanella piezotolerans (strain WP3 / JCM 13877) TaxID=225849 RepID=B8CMB8_SHEPW|nr:Transcriptional regulator [Shewanella piezotolerans WP3]